MASFFDNLGQRIDQGIAGLYNRDQVVGLENQYTNQYGVQDTSGGVASDARHMSAMNNLSNTLSKSGLGIAMGLPSEFAGDMGAFGAGLINEIPALARGFNKENLGEIGEDITANFRGSFGTPNSTTAEDIYSQVFSGAVPQRFASGTPMGYGAAQASELTDLERDFPGMSTGDIIDSMNARQRANRFSGMGQMGPVKSNAPAALDMAKSQIDPNRIPGRIQESVEPKQGIFQGLQSKIGNLMDNPVTRSLGTAFNFARGSIPGMLMSGLGSIINRDPNAPSYQQYSPQSYLKDNNLKNIYNANPSMINDFYDDNPDSDTFDTTRFDRATTNFGKSRTLKDYFERVKEKNKKNKEKKEAAEAVAQGRAYDYAGRDNAQGTHTSTMTNLQAQANQDRGRGNRGNRSGKPGGSAGFGKSFHGADGGRVGLASMFTRRR